jgi:hypothetical protein
MCDFRHDGHFKNIRYLYYCEKGLKTPKRQSETTNQRTKRKRTNNDLQSITLKTKIEQHESYQEPEVNSGTPEGLAGQAESIYMYDIAFS